MVLYEQEKQESVAKLVQNKPNHNADFNFHFNEKDNRNKNINSDNFMSKSSTALFAVNGNHPNVSNGTFLIKKLTSKTSTSNNNNNVNGKYYDYDGLELAYTATPTTTTSTSTPSATTSNYFPSEIFGKKLS